MAPSDEEHRERRAKYYQENGKRMIQQTVDAQARRRASDPEAFLDQHRKHNRSWKARNHDHVKHLGRASAKRRRERLPDMVREQAKRACATYYQKNRDNPEWVIRREVKKQWRKIVGKGVDIPAELLAAQCARLLLRREILRLS